MILAFVGVKMIVAEWWHIPTFLSLGVIAVILAAAIIASIKLQRPDDGHDPIEEHRGEGLKILEEE